MGDDGKAVRKSYVKYVNKGGGSGFAYFLGMIGSAVYWLQQSTGFWNGIVALLKALVWPAFLIYHLLNFIHG